MASVLDLIFSHFAGIIPPYPSWRRIEAVITSSTRNRVAGETARGFESHRLRHFVKSTWLALADQVLFRFFIPLPSLAAR